MRNIIFLIGSLLCFLFVQGQSTYNLKADSVKIKNASTPAELIIENSTKDTSGFLFNRGGGRTEFRRALQKINDSTFIIGLDTLRTNIGAEVFTPYVVTYSATPTFDYRNSVNQEITLFGNLTSITIKNIPNGKILYLLFRQDATGSRKIPSTAWPTGSKIIGGSLILTTTSNSLDLVGVKRWGTTYLITYGKDFK